MCIFKMWRLTNIFVIVLLYLECINSEEVFKQKTLYAYKGKILTKNSASDEVAAIWTISGILSVEDLTDHITFKLDNVKTRIFNGDPALLNTVQEKDIPEKSRVIQEPFVVYPGNKSGYNITHKPNEPIWALNMKRSIANIFFLNTDRKTNSIENETTIYGDCEARYKISNNEGITIWKIIESNCKKSPNHDSSNVPWASTTKEFDPIHSETKRIYHFDDLESLRKVESISSTTYQSMPGVRSKQIVEQSQEFTQISNTTVFDPINIAALTETSNIIFDYSEESESEKKSSSDLMKSFGTNYEEFKEYFEKSPLLNMTENFNDYITYMYEALEQMDKDTLARLEKKIMKRDDNLLQHLFVSYLPYLGTNESLSYIKDLVAQDDVIKDLLTIKILATLPAYINDISEEIVEKMEDLIDLKNVSNNQVKYAATLSFASIVSNAKGVLSQQKLNKYIRMYFKNFKEATKYETKMVWLLGLINMAIGIENNEIFDLITNSEYSRHLRVLAAYGFKEYVISEASSEIYTKIWPIVKNISEPFEVRVACLDLILYAKITEDQFENIVNWYKDDLIEPSERHLANYMYTSLKALQNTTGYYEHLGNYATETLANIKPLKINDAWSTGNYRMAYTDSDASFGASFQARLISNPITNILNSAFLTVDSFAHSLSFGRYSVYVKAEGIADKIYSYFLVNKNEEISVPKLLELIQKNAYAFKQTDNVHVDVVVFCYYRVVFSMHIDKHNVDNYTQNPLFMELLSLIIDYKSLSFPVYDYNYLISDLGTSMKIATDIVEISSYELKGLNQIFSDSSSSSSEEDDLMDCSLNYRSSWYYSEFIYSYNPLIDTNFATYKYVGEETRVHIPYGFNLTSMLLQWTHEKDAFNVVGDHLIGIWFDDKDILQEYCENCPQHIFINEDKWQDRSVKPTVFWQVLGVTFNITDTALSDKQIALNSMEPERTGSLFEVMEHHQAITFDNVAKPFLLLNHYATYHRYMCNDLYRYSIRSIPFYNDEPSETILELDFNTDDNSYDENPISRDDLNISIALTTRRKHNAEILSYGNVTFRLFSASERNSSMEQPHIHHKYDVNVVMYSNTESPIKACIDRDVQYPSRRTNKFSLEPVDSAKAITTFSFGSVNNVTSECPTLYQFYIMEIYSASEKQRAQMLASNEYKNCKEQSKDLKYTPPTDDCFAAHEIISKYENCDIYADIIPRPVNYTQPRTEHGVHLIRYTQVNDTHSKVTLIDEDFLEKLMDKPYALRKATNTPDFLPLMTINPRVIAYDDDSLEWGFTSACYITPNRVRTFTGHTLKKYYDKSGVDSVAFVECSNASSKGMTIQRYGDKYVGFHLYNYNDSIIVSVPNSDGKIKIEFNNEIITKTNNKINSDDFEIHYLDDDVIFITSDIQIFYTGEYISLEINSIYNNYICGLCAETQHH